MPQADVVIMETTFGRPHLIGSLLGLPSRLGDAHRFRSLGAVGERRPRRFGPAATLAHMVERCRVRLRGRLGGARAEKLEVRAADYRS